MKKQIANIITGCRIFCSMLMIFFPVFSAEFYITYLICGFTDMIDGTVARKTNSISEFGAKFDTVSDLIFIAVSLFKLFPVIHITKWLWIWIVIILIIKAGNIILGFVRTKKLISYHTVANKVTGLFLFLLPMTQHFIDLKHSATVVCAVATFSAIQEGYYIITGRESIL